MNRGFYSQAVRNFKKELKLLDWTIIVEVENSLKPSMRYCLAKKEALIIINDFSLTLPEQLNKIKEYLQKLPI